MTRGWPPTEFDGYRILNVIGAGGMGEVYLADDTLLDRLVAIKFIRSGTLCLHGLEFRRIQK